MQTNNKEIPSAAAGEPALSKSQIDEIVYQCRQSGNDTTYDIVNAAIRAALAYPAAPVQPAAVPAGEPPFMDTTASREYLIGFMNERFTDKTFHRYIRGEQPAGTNLAGDFAWQMARALRMIAAAPSPAAVDGAKEQQAAPEQASLHESVHGEYLFRVGEDGEYELRNKDGRQVGTILFYDDAQRIAKALVTRAPAIAAIREAALEEAAQLCEAQEGKNLTKHDLAMAKGCAMAICYIKKNPQAASSAASQPARRKGASMGNSTADLIAMIVDRDTPPDLDGDTVVDWDITGKPITRRMVNEFAKAKQPATNTQGDKHE